MTVSRSSIYLNSFHKLESRSNLVLLHKILVLEHAYKTKYAINGKVYKVECVLLMVIIPILAEFGPDNNRDGATTVIITDLFIFGEK